MRRGRRPLLVLAGLAAVFACGDRRERRGDIVLISIDTLRADRLGCTGYAGAATPSIDALARDGVLHPNGVAATPLTLPSHATLLSGALPLEHGVHDNDGFRFPAGRNTIAATLGALGYATIGVIGAAPLAPGCGLERDFDVWDFAAPARPDGTVALDERPAAAVTDAALARVDAAPAGEPLFLFVHYFDPHAPYAPPEPFRARFAAAPYDGEIAYVDREVDRLLDQLGRRRAMDGALVVLTSDHGESLGEHGEPTHGFFVYDATIRVPVVVRDPRVPAERRGRVDPAQVRHQDLRAFLEAFARGEPAADLAAPARRGEPAFIESRYGALHCDWAQLRGLRAPEGFKYLEAGAEELYDLAADAAETTNLLAPERAEQAETAASIRERLRATIAAVIARAAERTEPSAAIGPARTGGGAGVLPGDALPGYLGAPGRSGALALRAATRTLEQNAAFPAPAAMRAVVERLHEGVRLEQAGDPAAACAELERGIELDPENPSLWFWLGRARRALARERQDAGAVDGAIAAFERTLVLRRDHLGARDLLVALLCDRGRYEDAAQLGRLAEDDGTATAKTFAALARLFDTGQGAFTTRPNPLQDASLARAYADRAAALEHTAAGP